MTATLWEDIRRWLWPPGSGEPAAAPEPDDTARLPLAFVIDDEETICKSLSMILDTLGLETKVFP
jgi:hypothetical protein